MSWRGILKASAYGNKVKTKRLAQWPAAIALLAAASALLVACGANTTAPLATPTSTARSQQPSSSAAAPIQPTVASPTMAPVSQSSPGVPAPTDRLQRNQAGNVTIDVTWETNQASSDSLRFTVEMNTHSVDLDKYDLSKLSTLRTDKGREVTAIAWDGPSGGGHHRSGALVFPATEGGKPLIDGETGSVELSIRDVAGVKERVLRWNLRASQ